DLASVRESYAPLLKERAPGSALSDDVLTRIDELEIVDVTPAVLLARLRRGEIMSPAEAARALQAEFRPQILSALREMALRWLGEYAALVHREGGEFVSLHGRNVAAILARYMRKTLNTEVVLGRRQRRWRPWDTTSTLIRLLEDVDVHILRRDEPVLATTPTS